MRFFLVDAFTDTAYSGNPAGVVLLSEPAPSSWMQSVASELKHSETAFVAPHVEDPKPLRWFTPTTEVSLCGHATLAAAHVLGGEAVFITRSGELRCRAESGGLVRMDFPADVPEQVHAEQGISAALPGLPIEHVARGAEDILVVAASAARLREHRPDSAALSRLNARGVIVTAPGDRPGVDFVSRFFAPSVGVDEDPVTGSAHCTLAPYWARRLGRKRFTAEQASPRGGTVELELRDDRVALAGRAVTVARGELLA